MISFPNVKINLGLNVLRKREDGYHDLETLFVPYFGIHDTLEIIKGDEYSETSASIAERYDHETEMAQAISEDGKLMITIARKEGVDWDPLKDLTAKAYRLLDEDHGLGPVKIFLEKTSPVGAGLGGGSADAAFALSMISDIFGLGLDSQSLADYAAKLGSDCPFFVYNRPMFGEGRGEILSAFALEGIDYGQFVLDRNVPLCEVDSDVTGRDGKECQYHLEVVVPEGIAVSTAEAYRGIVPAVPSKGLREILSMPAEQWKGLLANDFEATVFKAHPELAAIKDSLYESGAVYAAMSGSGSALFGIYRK